MTMPAALKLSGHGADWYAKWLLHGLRAVDLGQDPGNTPAFVGAESLIHRDTNGIVGDLGAIRDRLDVSARTDFDEGVTEAVRRLDLAQHEDVVLAKQLTRVASLTGNREAVHRLALCLDPARSDDDARDLNVEVVGAIVAHPYPGDARSKEALYRLVRAASFNGNRAPQVLRALCAAAPADFVGHLVLLNRFFAPKYAPETLQGNQVRRSTARTLVKEIYALVDAAVFKAAFERWDTRCAPELGCGQFAFQQDWFAQAILRNSELAQLAREAQQVTASTSSAPSVDAGDKTRMALLWGAFAFFSQYIHRTQWGTRGQVASEPGVRRRYRSRDEQNGWKVSPGIDEIDQETRDEAEVVLFGGQGS
ncbi:hypothetical protein PVW51_13905 [Sulfitobacter sp. PR48]|uniref:hypothetical protein n=1 Tax=Sulfitobacter sp. PR48 TaxID=3028383 RepID=UPI00237BC39C|nr:hypothetical protein [Sulfitobacter sp. PR48]MDD9721798.1 hypothetical protein [Sulfitobacter sp. PR48]